MCRKPFYPLDRWFASIFALTLLVSVACAEPATLAVDKDSFREKFDRTVDVSGQLRAGLMFGSALEKIQTGSLMVSFKARTGLPGEQVCIRVASRDGVFTAIWTSTLDVKLDDLHRATFATEHAKELRNYAVDELVAIASIGQSCSAEDRTYLPSSWGLPQVGSLYAYLNADSSAAAIAARYPESEIVQKQCSILPTSEVTTAFDTVCSLTLIKPDLPFELVVLRQNFSTIMEHVRFPLVVQ